MTRSRMWGSVAAALVVAACSAGTSTRSASSGNASSGTGAATGTGGAGPSGSSSGTGGGLFDGGLGTGGGSGICTADNEAMYLFASGSGGLGAPALYEFLPKTKALTMVGPVKCATTGSPFAMSVDRNAVAWGLFDSGEVFKIDTTTAACTPTGYLPGQIGFTTFGMGFVADQQNTGTETLFITQADGSPSDHQLGSIDTTQSPPTISLVGLYNGGPGKPPPLVGPADATGTGDGRLFGFFRTTPVQIAQIDKASAKILGVSSLPGVAIGTAWAFAFWGGTFWLFTFDGFSPSGSKLQQYDPTTQVVTVVSAGIGPVVVGAGVSTCAPLTPPQ